ncbi:hypothetical protein GCE86_08940 [Micromonospora terminaliae]|uniref:Uncharacterized protein n=1 Tax=Micromonospora terminaliae TaxID=1914461 RepID=A0AAJ2ZF08_9ACTN|nr:hypothetical protein [Micromonospora terminaliae]NES28089.1 hypothetical protein [Micromonospora terminaliae]QGL47162.1 hypothetical protein GCE86_08940 [Micromonospora terminaliae]
MSQSVLPDGRPAAMSRLDAGLAVVLAVLAYVAGSALAPRLDPPWGEDGPAMATTAAGRRLLSAQQEADGVRSLRKALESKMAEERVKQVADRVAVVRVSEQDAVKLHESIDDREALLRALRVEADTAIAAQSSADRELRTATEKAKKSETAATNRLRILAKGTRAAASAVAWAALALLLLIIVGPVRLVARKRPRLIHMRTVLGGSALVLAMLLLAVTGGWIFAAAFAALLLLGWVVVTGRPRA